MKNCYSYLRALIACGVLLALASCGVSIRDKGVLRTHAEFVKERKSVSEHGRYPRWHYQGTNQEGLDVFTVPVQLSVIAGPQKFDLYKVVREVSPVKDAERFLIKEREIRKNIMGFDPKRTYFLEYR